VPAAGLRGTGTGWHESVHGGVYEPVLTDEREENVGENKNLQVNCNFLSFSGKLTETVVKNYHSW